MSLTQDQLEAALADALTRSLYWRQRAERAEADREKAQDALGDLLASLSPGELRRVCPSTEAIDLLDQARALESAPAPKLRLVK